MIAENEAKKNRSKAKPLPPIERLRELLIVDPTSPSGLRWRVNRGGKAQARQIAGAKCPNSKSRIRCYWSVAVDGVVYRASRIIYAMHYGAFSEDLQVDHINGDRGDNRAENLRIATQSQNSMNKGISGNNTSGVKGVHFCNRSKKWNAAIQVSRKRFSLGYFHNFDDARRAREEAELRLHGEFSPLARTEGA